MNDFWEPSFLNDDSYTHPFILIAIRNRATLFILLVAQKKSQLFFPYFRNHNFLAYECSFNG